MTLCPCVGHSDLWRYTADMLYLIANPVVREAFFPSGLLFRCAWRGRRVGSGIAIDSAEERGWQTPPPFR